jgi:hypothetical protein
MRRSRITDSAALPYPMGNDEALQGHAWNPERPVFSFESAFAPADHKHSRDAFKNANDRRFAEFENGGDFRWGEKFRIHA